MEPFLTNYVLVSNKPWHDELFESLLSRPGEKWTRLAQPSDFTFESLTRINPKKVFIPHWSYIIPESIYNRWECIVFHMTDLPYGRGGSPLQNLIVHKKLETKITALRVEKGIDTGPIYLKKPLSLEGSAKEIFQRSSPIIKAMVEEIIAQALIPEAQQGEVVEFKRRKPEDGNLENLETLLEVYNYIRMLDCEGYPNAFLETLHFKIDFRSAQITDDGIEANVRITKK
jgi:methionyl-tRNA formyltransferase